VTIQTMNRVLRLEMQTDDRVTVGMGAAFTGRDSA
jgi:hypothetical protein